MKTRTTSVIVALGLLLTSGCATSYRLSEAIRANESQTVSTILRNAHTISKDSERGGMLLWNAIANGSKSDIVSTLLDNGVDPNTEIHWNYTATAGYRLDWVTCPLNLAAWRGNADLVALLLSKGANARGTSSASGTPLYAATLAGNTNIVSLLMENGAEVKTRIRGTPCVVVSQPDQMAILSFFLDRGCNVNAFYTEGSTPLHAACDRGFSNLAARYLSAGADVDATDGAGLTPLHKACSWARVDAIRLLLDRGAAVNAQTQQGDSPLHFAATHKSEHTEAIIRLLLGAGARSDLKNKKGVTPLEAAKQDGNAVAIRVLMEANGTR